LPVFRPGGDSPEASAPTRENPSGQVTLRDSLALALLQSPELAAFAWELRAREARILQAARPPNPVISALVEDLGGSTRFRGAQGVIQPQTTIQLGQLIELGGKRAARQRLAERSRDLATWDYEMARIDVFTRVSSRLYRRACQPTSR